MPLDVDKFDVLKVGAREIVYGYKISQAPLISFDDGMCPLEKKGKWGFINLNGNLVHQFKYERVWPFNQGTATTQSGKDYFILHKNGKEIKITTEIITIGQFSDGLVLYKDKSKLVGYLDQEGKIAILPKFSSAGFFVDGLAWAKTLDKKVGFINKKGDWVIESKFTAAKNFDSETGLALVKQGAAWVYINKSGEITTVDATRPGSFNNGLAKGMKGEKLGFFNAKGDWSIGARFDNVRDFNNGFAAAKKGEKWGFINTKGDWVIEPTFGGVKDMELVK